MTFRLESGGYAKGRRLELMFLVVCVKWLKLFARETNTCQKYLFIEPRIYVRDTENNYHNQ